MRKLGWLALAISFAGFASADRNASWVPRHQASSAYGGQFGDICASDPKASADPKDKCGGTKTFGEGITQGTYRCSSEDYNRFCPQASTKTYNKCTSNSTTCEGTMDWQDPDTKEWVTVNTKSCAYTVYTDAIFTYSNPSLTSSPNCLPGPP